MAPRWFGTFGASLGAALSKQGFAPQETAAARVSHGSSPSFPLNRHTRRQPHPKSPCATLRTDDPAFRLVFVCVVEASIDTVNLCAVLAKLAPPSPLAFPLRDRPQRLGPVASCVFTEVDACVPPFRSGPGRDCCGVRHVRNRRRRDATRGNMPQSHHFGQL